MSANKRYRGSVTLIIIALILVIFPLISYYYIRAGFGFYREQMEVLKPVASIDEAFPALAPRHEEQLEVWHLACIRCPDDVKAEVYRTFIELADGFKGKDGLFFRSFSADDDTELFQGVPQTVRAPWQFHRIERVPYGKLPESEAITGETSYFVIIDRDGMIRNVYPGHSEDDFGRLMTHTAMLMPKASRKSIEIIRENEK